MALWHARPIKYEVCTSGAAMNISMNAGSALVRIHSALAVLSERELLPDFASVIKGQSHQDTMSKTEGTLCALFCLCRKAQLDPSRVAACPDLLLTFSVDLLVIS